MCDGDGLDRLDPRGANLSGHMKGRADSPLMRSPHRVPLIITDMLESIFTSHLCITGAVGSFVIANVLPVVIEALEPASHGCFVVGTG